MKDRNQPRRFSISSNGMTNERLIRAWKHPDGPTPEFFELAEELIDDGRIDRRIDVLAKRAKEDWPALMEELQRIASEPWLSITDNEGREGALEVQLFGMGFNGIEADFDQLIKDPCSLTELTQTVRKSGLSHPKSSILLLPEGLHPMVAALATPGQIRRLATAIGEHFLMQSRTPKPIAYTEELQSILEELTDIDLPSKNSTTMVVGRMIIGARFVMHFENSEVFFDAFSPDPDDESDDIAGADALEAWDDLVTEHISGKELHAMLSIGFTWTESIRQVAVNHTRMALMFEAETSGHQGNILDSAVIHVGADEEDMLISAVAGPNVFGPIPVPWPLVGAFSEEFLGELIGSDMEPILHNDLADLPRRSTATS